MSLFRKSPTTREAKLNGIAALAGYAVDQFTTAARDLEDAANQYAELAGEADDEAAYLAEIAAAARVDAANATRRANKIMELVG